MAKAKIKEKGARMIGIQMQPDVRKRFDAYMKGINQRSLRWVSNSEIVIRALLEFMEKYPGWSGE